jgi:hypothetical protein
MAAGKNDVIKLLPPLTLGEDEALSFLDSLDAVIADCQRETSKNWGLVRDIAVTAMSRKPRAQPR